MRMPWRTGYQKKAPARLSEVFGVNGGFSRIFLARCEKMKRLNAGELRIIYYYGLAMFVVEFRLERQPQHT